MDELDMYDWMNLDYFDESISKNDVSKYMLPVNFKQGNIIYFMQDSVLRMEIFYKNQINTKKPLQGKRLS